MEAGKRVEETGAMKSLAQPDEQSRKHKGPSNWGRWLEKADMMPRLGGLEMGSQGSHAMGKYKELGSG